MFEQQVEWLSTKNASNLTQIRENILSPRLQYKGAREQLVVRDLMSCFLVPDVDRVKLRKQISRKQKRFRNAAKKALSSFVPENGNIEN